MAFNTKTNFPTDGSANERSNRLDFLINNTAEIGAGSETLDGIVFNYTNRLDLINQLRTSLDIYLLDANADWNALEDEFSQTAIVNKWETQTGLTASQLPEKNVANTFSATNTFSSQIVASGGMSSSADVDLNNNNLIDANQLRFNAGIWLRSNNNTLEFSSDSGSNWEVVGVPRFQNFDIITGSTSLSQNVLTTVANYTGTGKISRIATTAASSSPTNNDYEVYYSVDGGSDIKIGTPAARNPSLGLNHESDATTSDADTSYDLFIDLYFDTSFTIKLRKTSAGAETVFHTVQYMHE